MTQTLHKGKNLIKNIRITSIKRFANVIYIIVTIPFECHVPHTNISIKIIFGSGIGITFITKLLRLLQQANGTTLLMNMWGMYAILVCLVLIKLIP